ncbi:hypothetical protein LCIT_19090 [Leuconostoc citreum]|uniref:Uncharacterized protein n=1 Tax=Leuconostoc citreum TaxID=33964 RepID=A0A5A5U131_LEUCI|nr:hypothetical protein LCIT_19090 [Leuconostoc citreum]
MLLNIIYWLVICLLIVVGALLIYKSYKYPNVNLAWWDYMLYFSVFILWIVVKKSVDITYLVSLITTLAVLYLLLATHKKS